MLSDIDCHVNRPVDHYFNFSKILKMGDSLAFRVGCCIGDWTRGETTMPTLEMVQIVVVLVLLPLGPSAAVAIGHEGRLLHYKLFPHFIALYDNSSLFSQHPHNDTTPTILIYTDV